MRIALIVLGILLLVVAALVTIADNVLLLDFISVTNITIRYVITGCLAALGIILTAIGLKKEPLNIRKAES